MGSLELSPINRTPISQELEIACSLISDLLAKYSSGQAAFIAIAADASQGIVLADLLKEVAFFHEEVELYDSEKIERVFELIDNDRDGVISRNEWCDAFEQLPIQLGDFPQHDEMSQNSDIQTIVDVRKQMQMATSSYEKPSLNLQLHRKKSNHTPGLGGLVRKCKALRPSTRVEAMIKSADRYYYQSTFSTIGQGVHVDDEKVIAIFGALKTPGKTQDNHAQPPSQNFKNQNVSSFKLSPSSINAGTTLLRRNLSHSPVKNFTHVEGRKRTSGLIIIHPIAVINSASTYLTSSPIKVQTNQHQQHQQNVQAASMRSQFTNFFSKIGIRQQLQTVMTQFDPPEAAFAPLLRASSNERQVHVSGDSVGTTTYRPSVNTVRNPQPTTQQQQQQQHTQAKSRRSGLEEVIQKINTQKGSLMNSKAGGSDLNRRYLHPQQQQQPPSTHHSATINCFVPSKMAEINGSLEKFRLISTMTATANQTGQRSNNTMFDHSESRINLTSLAFFRNNASTTTTQAVSKKSVVVTTKQQLEQNQQSTNRVVFSRPNESRKVASVFDTITTTAATSSGVNLNDLHELRLSFFNKNNDEGRKQTPQRAQPINRPEETQYSSM